VTDGCCDVHEILLAFLIKYATSIYRVLEHIMPLLLMYRDVV
jgi:hypothetical protein